MYLDRAKELLKQLGYIRPECIFPCTEGDIEEFEIALGVKIPLAYREFLMWGGKGMGTIMRGSDDFYYYEPMYSQMRKIMQNYNKSHDYQTDEPYLGRIMARELLLENNLDPSPIDNQVIIVFSHQGYQFAYIRADEGENPPVYYYIEGQTLTTPIKKHQHYSDYLETVIRDALKWATKVWNYRPDKPCSISQPDHFVLHLEAEYWEGNGTIPERIFNLINLEYLDLKRIVLTEISPRIGELKYLKHLDFSNNRISSLPKEMEELKNLEHLRIAGNDIRTIIDLLRHFPKLQRCHLERNPIPTEEIEQIQREFPNLHLQF